MASGTAPKIWPNTTANTVYGKCQQNYTDYCDFFLAFQSALHGLYELMLGYQTWQMETLTWECTTPHAAKHLHFSALVSSGFLIGPVSPLCRVSC